MDINLDITHTRSSVVSINAVAVNVLCRNSGVAYIQLDLATAAVRCVNAAVRKWAICRYIRVADINLDITRLTVPSINAGSVSALCHNIGVAYIQLNRTAAFVGCSNAIRTIASCRYLRVADSNLVDRDPFVKTVDSVFTSSGCVYGDTFSLDLNIRSTALGLLAQDLIAVGGHTAATRLGLHIDHISQSKDAQQDQGTNSGGGVACQKIAVMACAFHFSGRVIHLARILSTCKNKTHLAYIIVYQKFWELSLILTIVI